jgi:metal-responsive CopG/Arc/MetJ family transcriptional regulator
MHRILIHLPDELLTAAEDWQHANRVPNRSEALRQMLGVAATADRLGLVSKGELRINLSRVKRSA